MGDAGKGKATVATTLDDKIAEEFIRRGKAMGITKGAYLRQILEKWYGEGAPPVGRLDALLQDED